MLKEVVLYSIPCTKVNIRPQKIVKASETNASTNFEFKKILCDHVKLIPDDSKITIFNKGISKKLIYFKPIGGQILPIQTEGAKLTWKKHQKKEKKNIISEHMKS